MWCPWHPQASFQISKDTVAVYAEAIGGEAIEISNRYGKYFDDIVNRVSAVTSEIAEEDKTESIFCKSGNFVDCGKQSDINEIIELAGGIPVAKDVEGGSKTEITKEQFIEWNPDYIFVHHAGSSGNATAEEVINEMLSDTDYTNVSSCFQRSCGHRSNRCFLLGFRRTKTIDDFAYG